MIERSIDVVVPYCDAPERLTSILLALDAQIDPTTGAPLDGIDIVVADDASTIRPDTSQCSSPVRVVRQDIEGYHPASARNLGAAAGAGGVIAFLDGDTVPAPDYVATLVAPIVEGCADLTTGRRRHADFTGLDPQAAVEFVSDPTTDRLLTEPRWLVDGLERTDRLRIGTSQVYQYVISAVLAVRRSAFVDIDGFNERFDTYGGEDWEFAYRCWNAGWDFEHVPEAHAFHDGPDVEGRADDSHAKTIESLRIVDLVPASATRLAGVRYHVADLDVTMRLRSGDLRSNATCVTSILAGNPGDLTLTLDGADDDVVPLLDLVTDQRLVRRTRPTSPARCDVVVDAPVDFAPGSLASICDDVADGTLTERMVRMAGATVHARSRRHARRCDRGVVEPARLAVCDGAVHGLTPIDDRRFAEWARTRRRIDAAD